MSNLSSTLSYKLAGSAIVVLRGLNLLGFKGCCSSLRNISIALEIVDEELINRLANAVTHLLEHLRSPLCSSEELNIIALFGALSATLALELPLHHVLAADAAVRVVDGHGEGLEPDD